MDNISQIVSQYGYAGIFVLLILGIVGLPIPDETLLTLSGFFVYQGSLKLIPAFMAAFLGSCCGITLSYIIGTTFGLYLLERYGKFIRITPERIQAAHNWFEKVGRWALLVGYFVPGLRHIVAIIAGTSRLDRLSFAVFAYSGAFIWAATFFSIGYFFGEQWELAFSSLKSHRLLISASAAIFIVVLFIIKSLGNRNSEN